MAKQNQRDAERMADTANAAKVKAKRTAFSKAIATA
jgi:hypothetical protein